MEYMIYIVPAVIIVLFIIFYVIAKSRKPVIDDDYIARKQMFLSEGALISVVGSEVLIDGVEPEDDVKLSTKWGATGISVSAGKHTIQGIFGALVKSMGGLGDDKQYYTDAVDFDIEVEQGKYYVIKLVDKPLKGEIVLAEKELQEKKLIAKFGKKLKLILVEYSTDGI